MLLSGGIWRLSDVCPIWVAEDNEDIQFCLAIIAHTGATGRRGFRAAKLGLSYKFLWFTLTVDIAFSFRISFITFERRVRDIVPYLVGPEIHGTTPNTLLQFDYTNKEASSTANEYMLMLRNDHSGYSWCYPSKTISPERAAHTLLDWSAASGAPLQLMSDNPTHFEKETISHLTFVRRITSGFPIAHGLTEL